MSGPRLLTLLAAALIVKVTLGVVLTYGAYFPADFSADFLRGREAYFFGAYAAAFYLHILTGPLTLLLGLILMSEGLRARFPAGHRTLGKMQVALVLLLAPSGLWMARYAEGGWVAVSGFASLALATALCVTLGWRRAVHGEFAAHRRWMTRCFLLLTSAVVLRLIGGVATVTGLGGEWSYPLAAWVSWLGPLAVFEVSGALASAAGGALQSSSSRTSLSLPAIEISARRTSSGVSAVRK